MCDGHTRQMRVVVGVGRHLDGQLSAGAKCIHPKPEDRRMIGHPLQRRVGEHEVVVGVARPRGDVAGQESNPIGFALRCFGKHRSR